MKHMSLTVGELKKWLDLWPENTKVLSYDPNAAYYYDDARPEGIRVTVVTPGTFRDSRSDEDDEKAVCIL